MPSLTPSYNKPGSSRAARRTPIAINAEPAINQITGLACGPKYVYSHSQIVPNRPVPSGTGEYTNSYTANAYIPIPIAIRNFPTSLSDISVFSFMPYPLNPRRQSRPASLIPQLLHRRSMKVPPSCETFIQTPAHYFYDSSLDSLLSYSVALTCSLAKLPLGRRTGTAEVVPAYIMLLERYFDSSRHQASLPHARNTSSGCAICSSLLHAVAYAFT